MIQIQNKIIFILLDLLEEELLSKALAMLI